MQYSYILQQPVLLHVSQAKRLVFSDSVLQHPDGRTSNLEQMYPLSSTISTFPWTEFLHVTIKLAEFDSLSECHKNELLNFLTYKSESISLDEKSATPYNKIITNCNNSILHFAINPRTEYSNILT